MAVPVSVMLGLVRGCPPVELRHIYPYMDVAHVIEHVMYQHVTPRDVSHITTRDVAHVM